MPDIGWSELLLIAFVAIVVVGPKELPRLMAKVGRWSRAAQRAAREFQASLEQLAEESEAADVGRELRSIARAPLTYPLDSDPTGPSKPVETTVLPPEGGAFRPPSEEDDLPQTSAAPPRTGESS